MPTIRIADKPTLDKVDAMSSRLGMYNGITVKDDPILCKREVYPMIPGIRVNNKGLVTYKGNIHMLGLGMDHNYHYKYDGLEWVKESVLPSSFSYLDPNIVILDDYIYMFLDKGTTDTDLYRYDGESWTLLNSFTYDSDGASIVVHEGEIHILGGGNNYNGDTSYQLTHMKINLDSMNLETVSTLPYNFYNGCAVSYHDELYILGGVSAGLNIFKYDGNSWTQMPVDSIYAFIMNIKNSCALVYDDKIHILGSAETLTGTIAHATFDGVEFSTVSPLPFDYDHTSTAFINYKDRILMYCKLGRFAMYQDSKWSTVVDTQFPKSEEVDSFYYDPYTVVIKDEIHLLLIAGKDDSLANYHYKWDGKSWVYVGDIPLNYYEYNDYYVISYRDEIHLLHDGSGSSSDHRDHYKYDGTSWSKLGDYASFNINRQPLVVFNDKIYAIDAGHMYDGKSWRYDDLPYLSIHDLFCAGVVVYNNEIHLIGGSYNSTAHSKFDGNVWVSLDPLPFEFIINSVVVYNNNIHVILDDGVHYIYDGDSWIKLDDLLVDTSVLTNNICGGLVVYDDEIHAIGSFNLARKSHLRYDGSRWHYGSIFVDIEVSNPLKDSKKYYLPKGSLISVSDREFTWSKIISENIDNISIVSDREFKILKDDAVYLIPNTTDKSKINYTIL